jgi:hypothetical protein
MLAVVMIAPMITQAQAAKVLRVVQLAYISQSAQINIYKPVLDNRGDYVEVHGKIDNLASTKNLAQATGACLGGSFFSLADLQKYAPIIKQNGGCEIGYDLEKEYSPAAEMADPVGSTTKAANIAHSNGLLLLIDCSRPLTAQYAATFAKLGDIYNLQTELLTGRPTDFINYVKTYTPIIKSAHPGIPVLAEVSTNRGTLSQMKQDTTGVISIVDGMDSWFGSSTLTQLQNYLNWYENTYDPHH